MKILLLGGNGILGGYFHSLFNYYKLTAVTLGREGCDISSSEECREAIERKIRPDIVINTAAFTKVDLCESTPAEAFSVNAEGPKNIALSCEAIGARLIHFSTDYVFDGGKRMPYLETDQPNPINLYGKSKLKGEQFIQDISSNFLIVRIAGLFGKQGVSFVHKIQAQLSQKNAINVVNDQNVSPTYAKDVAEAVIKIMDQKTPHILHITNSGACNWWEFAQEILNLSQVDHPVQIHPIKTDQLHLSAPRPAYTVLSGELFQKTSGMKLRHWKDALKEFLATNKQINLN